MKKQPALLLVCIFVMLFVLSVGSVALADPYTITLIAQPEEGGTVTGGGEYQEGTDAVILASPAPGYTFIGWYRPDEDTPFATTPEYVYDQESSRTYIAKFEKMIQVGVIADPAEGGIVSQSGNGNYALDQQVTLTATPTEGYEFVGWFDEASMMEPLSTQQVYTFNVAGPISLIARFSPQYSLDVNITPEEGGTVTGAGQYPGGKIVILQATPNEDYRFVGWSYPSDPKNIISKEATYTSNLDGNTTYTAQFAHSYAYIALRVVIVILIAGGAAFGIFILVRKLQISGGRKNSYRRKRMR